MMPRMDHSTTAQAASSALKIACGPSRPRPTEEDPPASLDSETKVVNRMEAFWIKILHDAFRSVYAAHLHPGVVVFSKAYRDGEWARNEFLHDITVLERAIVKSAYRERCLPVARRVLWQIESELSGDGRDIAIDFSKLIAGSAENKLMIVRQPMEWQSGGQKQVCRFVGDMAVACSGNLFLAFLPAYHGHLKSRWMKDGPLDLDLFAHSGDGQFKLLPKGWAD